MGANKWSPSDRAPFLPNQPSAKPLLFRPTPTRSEQLEPNVCKDRPGQSRSGPLGSQWPLGRRPTMGRRRQLVPAAPSSALLSSAAPRRGPHPVGRPASGFRPGDNLSQNRVWPTSGACRELADRRLGPKESSGGRGTSFGAGQVPDGLELELGGRKLLPAGGRVAIAITLARIRSEPCRPRAGSSSAGRDKEDGDRPGPARLGSAGDGAPTGEIDSPRTPPPLGPLFGLGPPSSSNLILFARDGCPSGAGSCKTSLESVGAHFELDQTPARSGP